MGLNSQIKGEVDVHDPTTMDLVYEKVVKYEKKLKAISNCQENRDRKKVVGVQDKPTPKKVEVVQSVPKQGHKESCNGEKESNREHKRNGSSGGNTNNVGGNVSKHGEPRRKRGTNIGCFTCGGDHFARECPNRSSRSRSYGNLLPTQQAMFQQKIHATMDDHQAEYQVTPIETLGILFGLPIYVLIDTGATENFISPRLAKKLSRMVGYMATSWDVEYANQTREKVEQCLFDARIELPCFSIEVNLYVAHLGSYDVLLGMNWLWRHRAKVDFHTKTIEFLDDLGNQVKF